MASENKGKKVAIVGSGLVGKSWAMIFASVGYNVTMFDIEPAQVAKALANIGDELDQFEKDGVLRGTLKAAEQKPLITGSSDLAECVKVSSELIKTKKGYHKYAHLFLHQDAVYIQECVPEILDLKRKVWNNIDSVVTNPNTIMASSSSCIVPSKISNDLKHKDQFIIAHPVSRTKISSKIKGLLSTFTNLKTR